MIKNTIIMLCYAALFAVQVQSASTNPPCWTCPSGLIHWYDAGIPTAPGGDRCACVPTSNRGCWTCPAGQIHWFDAGLSTAPGGDRCACVPMSTPTTTIPNSIVVKNNKDVSFFSSPGGTSCTHSKSYDQVGQGRPSVIFSFSLDRIGALIPGRTFALLDVRSTKCANSNRLLSLLSSGNPSYNLVESSPNGPSNYCVTNLQSSSVGNSTFAQDGNGCRLSRQYDVTGAIYEARGAGKNEVSFILSTIFIFDSTNPNFCNRFLTPNVSTFYDNDNNCGILLNGRETPPSSFYLTLVNTGSITPSPTSGPTRTPSPSRTPSPTSPTTGVPCWTCPSGQIHWYDAGIPTAPGGDRCACVPTTNRGCWTCPPGFIHWFDAGLSTAPGGDRCACVRRSRSLAGMKL
ncbi:hypothetical protein AKO1_009107 [Acrasis kona]|uniref:Uncharacterized protein n=1 Tax=Acrasis kona TaxID=1008807 RepID=A0AAW2ZHJ3_9EUKA